MIDPCRALMALIEREFGFLQASGDYETVHLEAGRAGGCVLILEGKELRIRFQSTREEELNILIGDRSAPLGWGEEEEGARVWHYLREIAGYISGDISIGERYAAMTREELAQARATAARDLSSLLMRHIKQIEEMFSNGHFERLKDDYEQYLRKVGEETRAAYSRRSTRNNAKHKRHS